MAAILKFGVEDLFKEADGEEVEQQVGNFAEGGKIPAESKQNVLQTIFFSVVHINMNFKFLNHSTQSIPKFIQCFCFGLTFS